MSAKSSDKLRHVAAQPWKRVVSHIAAGRPDGGWKWTMILLLPLWVFTAFIVSAYTVRIAIIVLGWLHLPLEEFLRPTVLQAALALITYGLTISIVIGVPYLWRRHAVSLQMLGLGRLPSWTDIALAPVTYIAYVLVYAGVLSFIVAWISGFPISEVQNVGFKAFGSQTDNIMAFLALVILAPIAEETLFRGYLYGKLKSYVPAVMAALATSLLFALVHFQLNVGVDVFILSLFLCGLRSLTGSIWAGVLVHMIKNGVAYYVLFVSPLLGG